MSKEYERVLKSIYEENENDFYFDPFERERDILRGILIQSKIYKNEMIEKVAYKVYPDNSSLSFEDELKNIDFFKKVLEEIENENEDYTKFFEFTLDIDAIVRESYIDGGDFNSKNFKKVAQNIVSEIKDAIEESFNVEFREKREDFEHFLNEKIKNLENSINTNNKTENQAQI
jgi:hypothetical protein